MDEVYNASKLKYLFFLFSINSENSIIFRAYWAVINLLIIKYHSYDALKFI
jgi:hypothetical protein